MNLTELRHLIVGTVLVIVAVLSFNLFLEQLAADTNSPQWHLFDFYTDHHQAAPPPINRTINTGGGILISNDIDRSVAVYFPAGAVSRQTDIVYQYVLPYPVPSWKGMDRFFSLEAYQSGVPLQQFNKAVQITVYFSNPVDPDNQEAKLYWFDGSQWSTAGLAETNRTGNALRVETNHFTQFALLAEPEQVYLPVVVR